MVCLPKYWIEQNKLKAGDKIFFEINSDRTLSLNIDENNIEKCAKTER